MPAMITLVLGGARSGKSDAAERLVLRHPGDLTYVATGLATDADMAARIDRHQRGRDARFTTIEAGLDLARAVREAPTRPTLIDALGPWVAEVAHRAATDAEATVGRAAEELCSALAGRTAPTVVVSDEVGLGVHPETEVGRQFRDLLGLVNQAVADVADDVLLVIAGRVLPLARPETRP